MCIVPQVLLLQDYGLSAVNPQGSRLQPIKLTDSDPLLVHLASESAAYWRGLELLAGSPLMSPHATCDLVLQPGRDHPGAEAFAKLQVNTLAPHGLSSGCMHACCCNLCGRCACMLRRYD